eukprot:c21580_g1_i3.p1 GENE.c21580_g1_i3~~c21580_g1_i3.p1  ORF type:complete len:616 (+),score=151.33 c21580_g1_i3:119-1966(+)
MIYSCIITSLPYLSRVWFGFSTSSNFGYIMLFTSLTYFSSTIGCFLADSLLGRYRSILSGLIFCFIGLLMCAFSVFLKYLTQSYGASFIIGTILIAIGSGPIKANVILFGLDQFSNRPENTPNSNSQESFFLWYYWIMNLGSSFSFIFLSLLNSNYFGSSFSEYYFQSFGPELTFSTVFILLMTSFCVFAIPSNRYKKIFPSHGILKKLFEVIYYASSHNTAGFMVFWSLILLCVTFFLSAIGSLINDVESKNYIYVVSMCITCVCVSIIIWFSLNPLWIMSARRSLRGNYDGELVEEVSSVIKLLPFFGIMMFFWSIIHLLFLFYAQQGCQMDIRITENNNQLSFGNLYAFTSVLVLFFVPIFDKIILPIYRLFFRLNPTSSQKIGTGFCFAIVSVIIAAVIEIKRKEENLVPYTLSTMPSTDLSLTHLTFDDSCYSNCCVSPKNATSTQFLNCTSLIDSFGCHCSQSDNISYLAGCSSQPILTFNIWWITFQYLFLAISEVLVIPSACQLFYNQAPTRLKSACQTLHLLASGIGMTVSSGLIVIFSDWLKEDWNKGQSERVYFVLAFFLALITILFFFISKKIFLPSEEMGEARLPSSLTTPLNIDNSNENNS